MTADPLPAAIAAFYEALHRHPPTQPGEVVQHPELDRAFGDVLLAAGSVRCERIAGHVFVPLRGVRPRAVAMPR